MMGRQVRLPRAPGGTRNTVMPSMAQATSMAYQGALGALQREVGNSMDWFWRPGPLVAIGFLREAGHGSVIHFLDALYIAHALNAANAGDDAVEVIHVAGFKNDVDGGEISAGLGFDVADVGILAADDS